MEPYYREDLARIHAEGFGDYAVSCGPGILELLDPGVPVLEIGCGAGALTRELIEQGHHVLATDASEAMLDLLSVLVPETRSELLTLPDDAIPRSPAIVSVGHVVNYLESADAIEQAILSMVEALEPGGILVMDICDLSYGHERAGAHHRTLAGEGWEMDVTTMFEPPNRFIRGMTTRIEADDGSSREDHETHVNILVDVMAISERLTADGYDVETGRAIGDFTLPEGMYSLVVRV